MNYHAAPDAWTASYLERFSSHLGMMDNNIPLKVSGKNALPSPVIGTIDSYLREGVEGDDDEPYDDELPQAA